MQYRFKKLMYCGVAKEFTSVRQSQEAEAASNYGNEPQRCNCLPKKKEKNRYI